MILLRCWDIVIEVDIIEEVVCIYGYDYLFLILLSGEIVVGSLIKV